MEIATRDDRHDNRPGKPGPLDLARSFAERLRVRGEDVLYFRGDLYSYKHGLGWDFFDPDEFRSAIYDFLESSGLSPQKHHCENVLDALKAVCHFGVHSDPCWINPRIEPAKDFLACRNGLVHLPSRELRPSDPDFFTVGTSDFAYDRNATDRVVFENFLLSAFGNSALGLDTVAVLQEISGWLVARGTSLQKAFLLVGQPRSGKGTFARLLSAMVGSKNICSPTLQSFSSDFGLASLIGKPLAIVSDARISNRVNTSAVVENILRITGEDCVNIPRKFRSDWIGTLPTRILILSNEVPSLLDSSGAFASRFVVIHFPNSFLGKEDPELTGKLLAELPAIFNWALEGLKRVQERGYFVQPKASAQALELLRATNSPIQDFVADTCFLEPGACIQAGKLFEAWSDWCDKNHRDLKGTAASFGKSLYAAFPQIERRRGSRIFDGSRPWSYFGLRLAGLTDPVDCLALGPRTVGKKS